MRAKITFLIVALILVPLVSAAGFDVEINPIKDVTTEVQAAIFDVVIKNDGANSRFEIFTLNTDLNFIGEVLDAKTGESVVKRIKIYPKTDRSGLYAVNIFVKSQVTEDIREVTAIVKLVSIENALRMTIEPALLQVNDKSLTFKVKNAADASVENVRIEATSELFSDTFEFSLNAKGKKNFAKSVDLSKAEGGTHDIDVKVFVDNELAFESKVPYTIEEIYDFEQSRSITGFLVKQKKYTFENEGNMKEEVSIEEDSTMLEKIFSYFSEKPTFAAEGGLLRTNWDFEVEPYTTEEIIVKTNYLLPLIILAIIIVGFAFTVNYQSRGIIVTKTASKATSNKGTALKIAIHVKNRKEAVRDIRVKDHLPRNMKVYEKFDFRKPTKVGGNFIEWHLPLLQGGEERVFTYYAYTESEMPGAFILPQTAVHYLTLHRDPKTEHGPSMKVEVVPKIKVVSASDKKK